MVKIKRIVPMLATAPRRLEWWNKKWAYGLWMEVKNGQMGVKNHIIQTDLDLSQAVLRLIGRDIPVAPKSIRVIEYNNNGRIKDNGAGSGIVYQMYWYGMRWRETEAIDENFSEWQVSTEGKW